MLGELVHRGELAALLGEPEHACTADIDAALASLERLALVWQTDPGLWHVTAGLRRCFPRPFGLGPPLHRAFRGRHANRGPVLSRRLDDLVRDAPLVVEPVTAGQVEIARQAYQDFGRGSGNAARLNFGDCFSCALARSSGEPLLFKGFTHTDVETVLPV